MYEFEPRAVPNITLTHLGGKIELRMSSVCVVSFSGFFEPFFPLAPPVVFTKIGVLYFTKDAEF